MTPKQEARELYHRMLNTGHGYISDYAAKRYADETVSFIIENGLFNHKSGKSKKYWTEVWDKLKEL